MVLVYGVGGRQLWVRDRSDAFASLLRVSSFVNASEVAPYFKLSWPLLLLRAKRDPSSGLRPPSQPLLTVRQAASSP